MTLQGTLPVTSEKAEKDQGSGYNKARTIEAQYRAALTKLDYEDRTGSYVSLDEVRTAAFNLARTVRDAVLNVPDRVAPILAAETDPQKINAILARELRIALEELKRGHSFEPVHQKPTEEETRNE